MHYPCHSGSPVYVYWYFAPLSSGNWVCCQKAFDEQQGDLLYKNSKRVLDTKGPCPFSYSVYAYTKIVRRPQNGAWLDIVPYETTIVSAFYTFYEAICLQLALKTYCIQRAWEYCSSRQPQATQASIFMGATLLSRKKRFLYWCGDLTILPFGLDMYCWVGNVGIQ